MIFSHLVVFTKFFVTSDTFEIKEPDKLKDGVPSFYHDCMFVTLLLSCCSFYRIFFMFSAVVTSVML